MKLINIVLCAAVLGMGIAGIQSCSDNEGGNSSEVVNDGFVATSKDTTFNDAVVITWSGTAVSVTNPYADAGVEVAISDRDVEVVSTVTDVEVNYVLSGTVTDGSLTLYSDYRLALILNGVNITNDDGPAINIQSKKKISVNVLTGTTNKLVDGASYATRDIDQKSTLFSEGQLVFSGLGTLSVTGRNKHGVASDDYIDITEGAITIASAASDGIHASDYFSLEGGSVTVTASADGIDAEEGYVEISGGTLIITSVDDGITASYDGTDETIIPYVTIGGGNIQVNTSGDKAYAVKSKGALTVNGSREIILSSSGKAGGGIKAEDELVITDGSITITTSGAAFYDTEDGDLASASGVNSNGSLEIEGGTLNITSSGSGGKGISVDGTINVSGGTIHIETSGAKFTYSNTSTEPKAVKADGAVVIEGGSLSISSTDDGIKSDVSVTVNGGDVVISKSTEGIEAPAITFNKGNVSVTASDDGVNGTKGNGGENNDNSLITFAGGVVALNSTGGDAIDSNGSVVMTGGTVIVQGPSSAPEVALDYNGTFKISGGLLIASGPNAGGMIQAVSTSSTQNTMLVKLSSSVSANTLFDIQDASGNSLVTYKPARNAYYFVFSSPDLQTSSSYKVYTGGSVSGGTTINGLVTGGTYSTSGATLKGTSTINSKVTTSNF